MIDRKNAKWRAVAKQAVALLHLRERIFKRPAALAQSAHFLWGWAIFIKGLVSHAHGQNILFAQLILFFRSLQGTKSSGGILRG
jgi:hypothetical protein